VDVGTPNLPLTTYGICDGSGVVGVETDEDSLEELDTLSLLCVILILFFLLSPRYNDCRREDLSSFDLLEDFVPFVLVVVELDIYNDVLREFVGLVSVDLVREVKPLCDVKSTGLDKYMLLLFRAIETSDLAGETARDEATERAGETDRLGGNA
jgi:hypothetical protein